MAAPEGNKYAEGNNGGRPRKYSAEQIEEIMEKMEQYIEEAPIPILDEFAYRNNIKNDTFRNYKEFSELKEKLFQKKKAQLQKMGLANKTNSTITKLLLSHHGIRERQEIEHQGNKEKPIEINLNKLSVEELEKLDLITSKLNKQ